MTDHVGTAAEQWAEALAQWAIPDEILRQAPVAPWAHPPALFKVDPAAEVVDTPSHRAARAFLDGGGTVLDVGCGGGGSSLPLVPPATRLVGVDEQQGMLDNFAAACEAIGVAHAEVRGVWPEVASQVDDADVVVCHHVAYNVAPIGPFVRELAGHARRGVVVELPDRHPTSPFNPLWKRFWDLERPTEPSAGLFVEVVRELGYEPEVEHFERPPRKPATMDRAAYVEFVRTRLCLTPDRDDEVERALGDEPLLSVQTVVTVSWTP